MHYVNSQLDAGKIIMQKKVKVSIKENPQSLKEKILKQEHQIYPKAISKVLTSL